MKININHTEKAYKIPVWRGEIKNGYVWENGTIDFEQSRMRTTLRQHLKDAEALQNKLTQWEKEVQ